MNEPSRLSCIFGCEADDSLAHYLCCDPLWTAVISNSFKNVELLQSDPATKLGFVNTSTDWLQMTALAFACYHSIKLGHRPEVDFAIENGDFSCISERLMAYAHALWAECDQG